MGDSVTKRSKSCPKSFNNKVKVGHKTYNNFVAEKEKEHLHQLSCGQHLQNYFSEYCSSSGIHGVRYLGERGRFFIEKLTWFIVIVLVWYFCISSIFKAYSKWVRSPVMVTFATKETAIYEIPFPAVTICPEVKADPHIFNFTDVILKKLYNDNITAQEKQYYESLSLICTGLEVDENLAAILNGNLTVTERAMNDMLDVLPLGPQAAISWLGEESTINATLSGTFTSEGFCYTFNRLDADDFLVDPEAYVSKGSIKDTTSKMWSLEEGYPSGSNMDAYPLRTFMSGISGGFEIDIFTNNSHLDYLCTDLQGFKVTLHHPSELPNMDRHFRLPLNQAVLVAVKPRMIKVSEELKAYQAKDRQCYFATERKLKFFKYYSQENCLDECLSNYTLKACGCIPFYMPKLEASPICGPGSKECLITGKITYLMEQANSASNGTSDNANSGCNCLPSCTSLEYDVEITQTDWDWQKSFEVFDRVKKDKRKTPDYNYKTGHASKLAVYYREMQFLSSERHELYGSLDFFSNTGGLLGLFIGFSVTSAIEILYFLTLRLVCNIKKFGRDLWQTSAVTPVNVDNIHENSNMAQKETSKNKVEETSLADGFQPVILNKKPSPTWKENLDYYFSQYCGATSIHGVQYLGERGRFIIEKIFWAIIIFIVWYLCIMLICRTYNKWVTSPVMVSFATTETPIFNIPFPAITICPSVKSDPNVFNFTDVFVKKLQKKKLTQDEIEKFEAFSLICSGLDYALSKGGDIDERNLTVTDDILFKHLREAFPEYPENLTISWLGKDVEFGDLTLSFSSAGLCYSFNMLDDTEILKAPNERTRSRENTKAQKWSLDGGYPSDAALDTFPKRTFISGMDGGFKIFLPTNDDHVDHLCGEMLQGFKLTLHHPCEMPNMDRHIQVPLDQAVFVAVKPRMLGISDQLKSYKIEERECFLTNERSLALFQSYTQQNCFDECLSNYTLLKCGCTPFYLPSVGDSLICGAGKKKCEEESKANYVLESDCNCLPSCTSLEYDMEISQTDFKWPGMFQTLRTLHPMEGEDWDYKKMHLSMVSVYYKEMQFLTSERNELYGYVDFFSNTGGLLGLFIGFSVTSAIEILYFLTLRLGCNIRKFGQRFWSGAPELVNSEDIQKSASPKEV